MIDTAIRLAGGALRLALAPLHFVGDRIAMRFAEPLDSLAPGEGRIVDLDGRKVAAYRDGEGEVHALDPICTHVRCVVQFDSEAREWACPCHGSRFGTDGSVVRGPARRPLARVARS
jgi:Rieske Fe-S protein